MNTLALIPDMSGLPEILVVVFVVLLLFGAKRLPELFRALGMSLNEFKQGMAEGETDQKPDGPSPASKDPSGKNQ